MIPLLWRAQEQEGWVSRPAIEAVARMLDLATIRVLEVATFYFMFQLQPVGSVAHVQVCGTTSCMICGAEDLIAGLPRRRSPPHPHEVSADGKLSWEEVECLGACANAPMAQIGKDYYEDLTAERFAALLDAFARAARCRGRGRRTARFASEPLGGPTSLTGEPRAIEANASVTLALALGDTVARVTGESRRSGRRRPARAGAGGSTRARRANPGRRRRRQQPEVLDAPRGEGPDDLKLIKGVGPKLEGLLHRLGRVPFRPDRGLDPRRRSPGSTRTSESSRGGSFATAGSSRRAS